MDLAFIHNSILSAGIPLIGVESPDGVAVELLFEPSTTLDQRQQAQVIASRLSSFASPDYERFKDLLRGGGLFATALGTSQEKAWTVLLSTLESNAPESDPGRLADFSWSLAEVVAGLPESLSAPQLQQLNGILIACGFVFQL